METSRHKKADAPESLAADGAQAGGQQDTLIQDTIFSSKNNKRNCYFCESPNVAGQFVHGSGAVFDCCVECSDLFQFMLKPYNGGNHDHA